MGNGLPVTAYSCFLNLNFRDRLGPIRPGLGCWEPLSVPEARARGTVKAVSSEHPESWQPSRPEPPRSQ